MIGPPRLLLATAAIIGVLLGAGLAAAAGLVIPWRIDGPSMLPTLSPGDRVLVDRWTYGWRLPRRGEVVLLADPSGRPVVKRVSASVRGLRVEGDNPARSEDSRTWGVVEPERIRGRVAWRYWPPARFGPIS